jgi:imidazolonepropionase-like amidohydrolase
MSVAPLGVRCIVIGALLGVAGGVWACGTPANSTDAFIAFHGATLIDGTGTSAIPDAVVVIKDDVIVAAGSRDRVEIPPNARSIDVTGKWLMPAMSDAHMHFSESGGLYARPDVYDLRKWRPHEREVEWTRARLPYTLSRYLCAGITSVLALAEPREALAMRDTAASLAAAPRVFVAGPFMANIPFGEFHQWMAEDPVVVQVTSPEEVRALVREQAARGVDIVKLGFINDAAFPLRRFVPVLEAAIQESHQHRVRVAVHAEELETAKAAVRAGADLLAHTVNDQPVDEEFLRLLTDHNVIAVTSLGLGLAYARVLLSVEDTPLLAIERSCGDPEVIGSWSQLDQIPADQRPTAPEWARRHRVSAPRTLLLQNIKRMHDAGVQIALGSDGGNIGTLHGASYHRELRLLADAGIPPMDILVAATRTAAAAVTGAHDRGTIQAGRLADMLILDADPLADIGNLGKIHAVVKGGALLEHASLVASR